MNSRFISFSQRLVEAFQSNLPSMLKHDKTSELQKRNLDFGMQKRFGGLPSACLKYINNHDTKVWRFKVYGTAGSVLSGINLAHNKIPLFHILRPRRGLRPEALPRKCYYIGTNFHFRYFYIMSLHLLPQICNCTDPILMNCADPQGNFLVVLIDILPLLGSFLPAGSILAFCWKIPHNHLHLLRYYCIMNSTHPSRNGSDSTSQGQSPDSEKEG